MMMHTMAVVQTLLLALIATRVAVGWTSIVTVTRLSSTLVHTRRPVVNRLVSHAKQERSSSSTRLWVGDARGDYYGESAGSFMVKEFNTYDQLQEVVSLAAMPLPERPDGIVLIAKFTKASSADCRTTEAEYERLARSHPSTVFLRCFAEYDSADLLCAQADVVVWPTFDIFYRGNRVARVEGPNHLEVEELLQCYQLQNSQLDLFSEVAPDPWGDGIKPTSKASYSKTPRTTARFVPGYDWNSDRGFFDATATKMENDFMGLYESSWIPNPNDDDNDTRRK